MRSLPTAFDAPTSHYELLLWHLLQQVPYPPCSAATTRRYFLPTEFSSHEKKDAFPTALISALTFALDLTLILSLFQIYHLAFVFSFSFLAQVHSVPFG